MPNYEYKALSLKGKKIEGNYEAHDRTDVIRMLREKEYTPLKIKEKEQGSKDVTILLLSPIKLKDLSIFCRQFYTMLNSGVSIIKSLDILRQQTENKKFRRVIGEVYEDVQKGLILSDALKNHTKVFPELFINMIVAGESSGNLDIILERMAVHYEKENKIKNKVKGAMVYPIVLGILAICTVVFLLTFVMPTFVGMFISAGIDLPAPTRILLEMSDLLLNYWYLFMFLIIFIVFIVSSLLQSTKGKLFLDSLKLNIPIIKSTNEKIITSRFSRTLSTLLSSGIPLLRSLEISANVVSNEVVKLKLMKVRDEMTKGAVLSKPIKDTGIFPPMLDSMIQIGEESGAIDDILEKTANFYDDEVEAAIQKLLTLIEPLMIVLMALLIGGIVIAMILPMFEMFNTL